VRVAVTCSIKGNVPRPLLMIMVLSVAEDSAILPCSGLGAQPVAVSGVEDAFSDVLGPCHKHK